MVEIVPQHFFGVAPNLFKSPVLPVSEETFLFTVGSYIAQYDVANTKATFPVELTGEVTAMTHFAINNITAFIAVALKKEDGTTIIQVINLETKATKTLTGKFGVIHLLCFTGKNFLCSLDENGLLIYWKWDNKKIIGSTEVKNKITQMYQQPKNNVVSLCGQSYLRLLELNLQDNYVREVDTFLPLKTEKHLSFVDHVWLEKTGTYMLAVTKDSYFLFEGKDLNQQHTLKSWFDSEKKLQIPGVPQPSHVKVEQIEIISLSSWSKGFCIGGTQGFFGVFTFKPQSLEIDCLGIYWLEKKTEIVYISPQSLDAPLSVLTERLSEPDHDWTGQLRKERKCYELYTFNVAQCDMIAQQLKFEPIFPLGFHQDRIMEISSSSMRSCFVTASDDAVLKIWKYEDNKPYSTELSHIFEYDGTPNSIAIHPLGFHLAAAFSDRVRVFHINADHLTPWVEVMLKNPTQLTFNHSGNLLAVAALTSVMVYDYSIPTMINIFSGHLTTINRVIFSDDDKLVMSCGADGCVYGWTVTPSHMARHFEHVSKGTNYHQIIHDLQHDNIVCLAKNEELLRLVSKNSGFIAGDVKSNCTSLLLARPLNILLGGTQTGSIKAYKWPIDVNATHFAEYALHSSPVTSMAISLDFTRMFSSDMEGIVMCSEIKEEEKKEACREDYLKYRLAVPGAPPEEDSHKRKESIKRLGGARGQALSNLTDFVFISKDMLNEKLSEIKELEERMENLRNETDYTLALKDQETAEKMKILNSEKVGENQTAESRYDQIVHKLSDAHGNFDSQLRSQSQEFEISVRQQDRQYENRLIREYDKQNRLLNEIQNLKDNSQKQQEQLNEEHEKKLDDVKEEHARELNDWRMEYEKMLELLKSSGLKFEEALRQQEEEYENEIQEVNHTKVTQLQAESEKSNKALKEQVSIKNNVLLLQKQLKEKDDELRVSQKARDDMQKRLDEMTLMYNQEAIQCKERDKEIEARDGIIDKLREHQKHLESFRFVLFHKVRELEEERDPLEGQVSSLRQSVQDMSDEIVKELRLKQKLETGLQEKTVKAQSLLNDTRELRATNQQIKKDFSNLYGDIFELTMMETSAKALLSHIHNIVKKYDAKFKNLQIGIVKEDNSVSLPLITEEIMHQRDALLRKCKSVTDSNNQLRAERTNDSRKLIDENSTLISELNNIRVEKKGALRKIKELDTKLFVYELEKSNTSPKKNGIKKIMETPYQKMKKGSQEQVYRLEQKKMESSLPPRIPERDHMKQEYVRKKSEKVFNQPSSMYTDDEVYTGGPINPEHSIPKMNPPSVLGRK